MNSNCFVLAFMTNKTHLDIRAIVSDDIILHVLPSALKIIIISTRKCSNHKMKIVFVDSLHAESGIWFTSWCSVNMIITTCMKFSSFLILYAFHNCCFTHHYYNVPATFTAQVMLRKEHGNSYTLNLFNFPRINWIRWLFVILIYHKLCFKPKMSRWWFKSFH